MNFLQPAILFALPLVALPILIHLINQNRYRTVHWAATMFLLQAKRMAKGMARLRYILLMIARMLAIAGLILAVARPMAGGWLGLATGGAPETTIVVLDRSVSMNEQNPRSATSKRETALQKLAGMVRDLESRSRIVLVDSATGDRMDLNSAQDLPDLPETTGTATASDIPLLMQSVADHITTSQIGRADVWICSDLRRNDWDPAGGRWAAIRQQLEDREGLRFYLLSYPQVQPNNLAVSVSGVHRRESAEGAELVMDIHITRSGPADQDQQVPVTFVIDDARSTLDVTITGAEFVRNGHAIPIDRESRQGWGRIELPRDNNPADDVFHFVYSEPAVRKTVIVSDSPQIAEMLRIAAATPSERSVPYEAEIVASAQAAAIDWENTALILWQSDLPTDILAQQLEAFVNSGGALMVFPPEDQDSSSAASVLETTWGGWQAPDDGEHFPLNRWRTDTDLLANTRSGTPLPVGQLRVFRKSLPQNPRGIAIATFADGTPLLTHIPSDNGAVWFCSTLPETGSSNLVSNGVTFYVMIQRALARGASRLGTARQIECGSVTSTQTDGWQPVDDVSRDVLLMHRPVQGGIYEKDGILFAL
ncbi:MAG: BatA domain-containing protein, partial [Planctomycetaceae bacterium]|nr:BatA domain-containing protein [Planctomycetaceae bacterium]